MALQLFFHPFSSYSQKALIALHENGTAFTPRVLSPDDPATGAEFAGRSPFRRFPVLVDGERTILEATAIIEYLEAMHPGRLRRRAGPVLCRLDASDRCALRAPDGVSPAPAGAAVVRARGRRGTAVQAVFPAGRARQGLADSGAAKPPRLPHFQCIAAPGACGKPRGWP